VKNEEEVYLLGEKREQRGGMGLRIIKRRLKFKENEDEA